MNVEYLIRAPEGTPLTVENVKAWIKTFRSNILPGLIEKRDFYLNNRRYELPFAKKLVTISAGMTYGDGITFDEPNTEEDGQELNEKQKALVQQIKNLFKRQIIGEEDLAIITDGCIYGHACEIVYASADENPVPKAAALSPLNCFVVFDDTVEMNSLYGICFEVVKDDNKTLTKVTAYDEKNKYVMEFDDDLKHVEVKDALTYLHCDLHLCAFQYFKEKPVSDVIGDPFRQVINSGIIEEITEHKIGRMPITMYFNNRDMQGDFDQVMRLIDWRNKINRLAMDDSEKIAENILLLINSELAGDTEIEKGRTLRTISKTKVLELLGGGDARYLTKDSSYNMVSVYGKDLDEKIFSLSMIVNFDSSEFSGNLTGVALRLRLFPFKRLVKNKDTYIEKLYRRRIKMYADFLMSLNSKSYEAIDIGLLDIQIHRTWEENISEIAQTIATLNSTGIFSNETLVNMLPQAEYKNEVARIAEERENSTTEAAFPFTSNNTNAADLAGVLRNLSNGTAV